MISRRRAVAALTVAGTLLAVTGCGGGGSTTTHAARTQTRIPIAGAVRPEPGGADQSGGVVAWVGHTPVTRSALEHRIAIEVHSEESGAAVPVPPAFSACVAQLATGASGAGRSAAELRAR